MLIKNVNCLLKTGSATRLNTLDSEIPLVPRAPSESVGVEKRTETAVGAKHPLCADLTAYFVV